MAGWGGAFIETTRVPGVSESELLGIQIVTRLAAGSAQQRPEGGDFLSHRCSHRASNGHCGGMAVAQKFGSPAPAGSWWSSHKNVDFAHSNPVQIQHPCNQPRGVPPRLCDETDLYR